MHYTTLYVCLYRSSTVRMLYASLVLTISYLFLPTFVYRSNCYSRLAGIMLKTTFTAA